MDRTSLFCAWLAGWLAGGLAGWLAEGIQKAPGRRNPKSGQFYQQLTNWEAAFLKGPNSRKKASKMPLVASSQKVASFVSNSHIGKPFFYVKGPKSPYTKGIPHVSYVLPPQEIPYVE